MSGGHETEKPEEVHTKIRDLLERYNGIERARNVTLDDIIAFHAKLEYIHPFQDGNGRVGRLVSLKECHEKMRDAQAEERREKERFDRGHDAAYNAGMLIQSKRVYISGLLMPAELEIKNGKIERIFRYGEKKADRDFGNLRIVPGFIDIHCHGAYGFDTNCAGPEGLRRWAKNIAREGVTGFLATTVTAKHEVLERAVRNVASVKRTHRAGADGADILGIHMEGPYIDAAHRGSQPEEAIVPPSTEEFRAYQEAAEGLIRVITLAPEHDRNFELTRYCRSRGVAVSIGHTGAAFEQAALAFANGARSVTHTFNGQTGFHHREAGAAGAALRFGDIYSEIICDCLHTTPEALHIFFSCKERGRAVMVSDSLLCKGLPAGTRFLFGGQECELMPDGTARLAGTDTLAGSTMRMIDGLKNLVTRAQVPFDAALDSCTANPAALLGMGDRLGRIAAGYDADLAVLTEDYRIGAVFCKGISQMEEWAPESCLPGMLGSGETGSEM